MIILQRDLVSTLLIINIIPLLLVLFIVFDADLIVRLIVVVGDIGFLILRPGFISLAILLILVFDP